MNDWQNPLIEQPEPELFPGSLIGYRQFRVVDMPSTSAVPLLLKSLYQNAIFGGGDCDIWNTAYCGMELAMPPHSSPSEDCRCGFYVSYLPSVMFNRSAAFDEVKAVVECAGKIVLATKGYRAQKMRIRGIAAPSEFVDGLAQIFPRVVPLEEWDSLVEEFPRSDYESLLGMSLKDLEFAPKKRRVEKNPWNQITVNFQVNIDGMRKSFEQMRESLKNLASTAKTLQQPIALQTQLRKEEPRFMGKSSHAKATYLDEVWYYADLDVEATKHPLLNLKGHRKDDTDT
jgi:hypothetical protein